MRPRSPSAAARRSSSTIDLSDAKAPAALVADLKKQFGKLDILVNNAGATKRGDFRELTDADWKDGFELKFFAHVRLAREAWPLLAAGKGSVVTIAGIGGKEPEAEFGIGSSVNAACVAWTKALADVGKKEGVQVNTIHPGRVETERLWRRIRARVQGSGEAEAKVRADMQKEFNITRFGLVEDIAGLIAFMASPHGRWLHGTIIDMDGGEVSMESPSPAGSRDPKHILLTPARIGSVEIRNRIVMPPMTTRLADADGRVTDDTVNYYMARVRGGVGLVTVEMASPERAGRHRCASSASTTTSSCRDSRASPTKSTAAAASARFSSATAAATPASTSAARRRSRRRRSRIRCTRSPTRPSCRAR